MARSGRIEVEILGDASGLSKTFKSATRDASAFGSKVSSAMGSIVKAGAFAGVAAGVVGITAVLKSGIGEWQEQAKVASATNAILKATKGVANVTAESLDDLAESLMAKTGMDDEAIKSGANLLLTFTKVRNEAGKGNDVFNRATVSALNLAQAGFGSVESASKLMGKALNDPIGGLAALSRVGIRFTEDQKKAIKAMVETGDVLGAQKLILADIEGRVGGVAEAYGKTLPGQIDVLKQQFSNLSGQIVGQLAPAFSMGLTAANNFLTKFSQADGAAAKFKVVMGTIKDVAVKTGELLLSTFRSINWTAIGQMLVDGFRRAFDTLVRFVRSIDWNAVGRTVGEFIVKGLNRLDDFVRSVNWNNVGKELIQGMGRAISAFGRFLAGVDWNSVLGATFRTLIAVLKGFGNLLLGIATELGGAIMRGLQTGLAGGWVLVKTWLSTLGGQIVSLFSDAGSWLISAGAAIITGFISGFTSKIDWAIGQVKSLGSALKNAALSALGPFHSPPTWSIKMGEDIVMGIGAGFQRGTQSAVKAVRNASKGILGEINKLQTAIDKINRRREDEDLESAIRDAQATLAQLRRDKKAKHSEIVAAENALERAREDIRLTAMSRELSAAQIQYDVLQTKLQNATAKREEAQRKADEREATAREKAFTAARNSYERALAARQASIDAANDKARASMDRLTTLIQRGLGAMGDAWVSPAQEIINAITDRRAKEDLDQAVTDAQERLDAARESGDTSAIVSAERALARAREDIYVASLRDKAAEEDKAHQNHMTAMQDRLAEEVTATGGNLEKIIGVINSYTGGFAAAGKLLGDEFATALREAMQAAVRDTKALAAAKATPKPKMWEPFPLMKFPALQTGGKITGTGLALLHRGETVVPAGRSAGVTVNVTVNGFVGNDQDIAQRVVDTINRNQTIGRMRFAT
jgi:hypothetical protein